MTIHQMKSFALVLTVAALASLGLAGCSGSDAVAPAAQPQPKTCADLNGMVIPAASIGLPTTGAVVHQRNRSPGSRRGSGCRRRILQGSR